MNPNSTLQEKIDKAAVVGPAFFADADATIIADGTAIKNAKTAAETAKTETDAAYAIYANLVIVQGEKEADLVKVYNTGVDDANRIYPHNEAKLSGLGLTLSLLPGERPLPGVVIGASVVKSTFPDKGHIHCHSDKNVDYYKIIESVAVDPTDMTAYYPSNPQTMDTSQSDVSPAKPASKTWFRLIPHNTTGDGPPSPPIGGFSYR